MSLYELLYSPEREDMRRLVVENKEKYSIALQISKILATLHQFSPPICHGHLTSHNIMLGTIPGSNQFHVRIADLELISILKH
jgi:tRNA A-37 threonylcarbamoyl transferase component Bud32